MSVEPDKPSPLALPLFSLHQLIIAAVLGISVAMLYYVWFSPLALPMAVPSEEYLLRLEADADTFFVHGSYERAESLYHDAQSAADAIVEFEGGLASADRALLDRLYTKRSILAAKRQIASFGSKVTQLRSEVRGR